MARSDRDQETPSKEDGRGQSHLEKEIATIRRPFGTSMLWWMAGIAAVLLFVGELFN